MNRRHALYRWFRNNQFKVDLTGMALLLLLFIPLYVLAGQPWQAILCTGLVVPLAWRRTKPVHAAAAIVAVCLVQWIAGTEALAGQIAVPLIVYAVAAYSPAWASRSVLVLGLVGAVMLTTRTYTSNAESGVLDLSVAALYTVLIWMLITVVWTLGDLTRVRRLQLQALQEQTHRMEIEQQQERSLAAADERSHIAREMHDIVAHSLSVIITQADGARYAAAADPNIARQTLETIAATGRSSLAEMRRLLGVLRQDDQASLRPLPGLADVDELLLGFRASGLELRYELTGEPRRQLPSGAELTAYRVIQEALTNVLKHAGPNAQATTSQGWTARGLQLDIIDNGRGAAADPQSADGNGLRGMEERISLYDGSLKAGPATGGGWHVCAYIPYTEA
ncbi:sensor histidine kinase [Pseudarthrobacter sp. PS3-L1]|uniref:sensor histidine kinase n=1 Tax=Pseudarthrobacter sp. PS3-L1 TaxID=3046207 RepID=UPI0024B9C5FE|nr:sensor histidine kinase [Pseudarthrobacter sp. PS3-L1]MDJ0321706.1 sensor histidine kinase [Pseudarthrobacter sp. PS3-L1]